MYSINSECLLGLRLHAKCFMENHEEKNDFALKKLTI